MSKTIRYFTADKLYASEKKKRDSEALARIKRNKLRTNDAAKLFKREVNFTTWIERTSIDD